MSIPLSIRSDQEILIDRQAFSGTLTVGAYGAKTPDLPSTEYLGAVVEDSCPVLRIRQVFSSQPAPGRSTLDGERGVIPLGGVGFLEIRRRPLQAIFGGERKLSLDQIVHPGLAAAGSAVAFWLGRQSFHAGAFACGSAAWGVAGTNQTGKSSLLAALSTRGWTVMADDLVVVEGSQVLAGPRCLDLRPGAAEALGLSVTSDVRDRTRSRMVLGDVPARLPLSGWLFLEWGEEVSLEPLAIGDRIPRLMGHRTVRFTPSDAKHVLDISSLPMWVLRRPRRWDITQEVIDTLRSLVAPDAG